MDALITLAVWLFILAALLVGGYGLAADARRRLHVASNAELIALAIPGPHRGQRRVSRALARLASGRLIELPGGTLVVPSRITLTLATRDYDALTRSVAVGRIERDLAQFVADRAEQEGWEQPPDGVTVRVTASSRFRPGWVLASAPGASQEGKPVRPLRDTRAAAAEVSRGWLSTDDVPTEPMGGAPTEKLRPVLQLVDRNGTVHRVSAGELTIGRSGSCDVAVSTETVSRKHARVVDTGAGWELHDLGSANGTFLNELRVDGHAQLVGGDRIRLGQQGPQLEVHAVDLEQPRTP